MPTINDVMEMAEMLQSKSVVALEDRCVAVRNRNAKCRRCAEACMVSAISIAANKVTIDAAACVGCGSCVAVCPTSAMMSLDPMDEDLAASVAAALRNAKSMAVIACARIASKQLGDPEMFATVPCLGRIDESLLISLAAHGVQDIVLVDGGCPTCKYGAASFCADDTVESAISLLECVGSEAIISRVSEFPPEVLVEDERKAIGAARRGFLTQASGYARNVAMTAAEKAIDDALHQSKQRKLLTLRDRLGAGKSGKMPTFSAERNMQILDDLWKIGEAADAAHADAETPECETFPARLPAEPIGTRLFGTVNIDASECSGCGMCVMFCPTAALKHAEHDEHADPEMRYLEFQAADCTQCGMCVDVCLRFCIDLKSKVSPVELFDFEPRLLEIPRPKKNNYLFARSRQGR